VPKADLNCLKASHGQAEALSAEKRWTIFCRIWDALPREIERPVKVVEGFKYN
jgi:hypothetical protein